jgi:hypothetical protein
MFIEIYDWCDKRDNENLGEWRYSAINWIFLGIKRAYYLISGSSHWRRWLSDALIDIKIVTNSYQRKRKRFIL